MEIKVSRKKIEKANKVLDANSAHIIDKGNVIVRVENKSTKEKLYVDITGEF